MELALDTTHLFTSVGEQPPLNPMPYEAPVEWGNMSDLTELSGLDSDSDSNSSEDVSLVVCSQSSETDN